MNFRLNELLCGDQQHKTSEVGISQLMQIDVYRNKTAVEIFQKEKKLFTKQNQTSQNIQLSFLKSTNTRERSQNANIQNHPNNDLTT